jgi:hypothetical protein
VSTTKKNAKPRTKTALAKPPTPQGGGYQAHKAGSRKGTIHELHDKEGAEVAWTRGLKMGLKQSTLRTWFAFWARQGNDAAAKKVRTNSAAAPINRSDAVATTVVA